MNTSRIISLTPDGSFQSAHGPLYAFLLELEDGRRGQANSKNQAPPYQVGDVVYYEVTGQGPKGDKLKVSKNPPQGGFAPSATPAPAAYRAQTPPTPAQMSNLAPEPRKAQGNGLNGATVGMAIKAAVDIVIQNARASEQFETIDLPSLQHKVEQIAASLIAASLRLEQGKVKIDVDAEPVPY